MKFDLTINKANSIIQAFGNAPYAAMFELEAK